MTQDNLGSPRVITDNGGNVSSRRDFMPFGEELNANSATNRLDTQKYTYGEDNVRKRFTGYEKDQETGLDFAEARYYNNQHGRFTAVDPMLASGLSSNPQTFNRYAYVSNNPTNATDPTGMWQNDFGGFGTNFSLFDEPYRPISQPIPYQETTTTYTRGHAAQAEHSSTAGHEAAHSAATPAQQTPQQEPEQVETPSIQTPCDRSHHDDVSNDSTTRASLRDYLTRSPIGSLIIKIKFGFDSDGKDVAYSITVTSVKFAVTALEAATEQFKNAGLGSEHVIEVGETSNGNVFDFRSYTEGAKRLGEKSLQINIGKTTGRIRADLDYSNPAQDVAGAVTHGVPIVVKKIGDFFRKIF